MHERELANLSEKIEASHQKQQLQLRDKLAQKRKRQLEQMKRKHEVQLTKEMLTQQKELDEIKSKLVSK